MLQNKKQERILVIKLSALGDFIQALGPMKAIREHHKDAHITLLTTKMFTEFAKRSNYFDDIMIDKKPKTLDLGGWLNLRKTLINGHFTRVYDLQNNDRTALYFKLFSHKKQPEWVGAAKGASHRNTSPERTAGHAFNGHKQTLALADIKNVEVDTLAWIQEDISDFDLKPPYILFVPGCAPGHPYKRWPAQNYGKLAQELTEQGFQIVILGTNAEKEVTDEIAHICPKALNLTGKTSLFQIPTLAHKATAALGNDTGPMHIIGPTGCPSLILFSGKSNPKKHAPQGAHIHTLQKDNISEINTNAIKETLLKIKRKA